MVQRQLAHGKPMWRRHVHVQDLIVLHSLVQSPPQICDYWSLTDRQLIANSQTEPRLREPRWPDLTGEMADRLDPVAVRVEDEGGVVAGMVVRP